MGYKIKPIFRLAVAFPYEFRDQATLGSASLPSAKCRPSPTYPYRGGEDTTPIDFFHQKDRKSLRRKSKLLRSVDKIEEYFMTISKKK
ncbi:hypothetical protein CH359_01615 [Leptospira meyeri]|nr:hypothetical protein CH359_01615 [Leptospira meyeri]PJZ98083.1 hypothetical protein CH358_03760 [Leptospira meyeri]